MALGKEEEKEHGGTYMRILQTKPKNGACHLNSNFIDQNA
jgi:hypothetical protein